MSRSGEASGVADIKDKMGERQLRWFGYVIRRTEEDLVRYILVLTVNGAGVY